MKLLFALLTLLAICHGITPMENFVKTITRQSKKDIAEHSWVVIVAGSTGYSNYRHQADMCHAYQLVHQAGVPDEHIITFMNDDIANNAQNPFKGQIFNYPYVAGGTNVNVYEGVSKDYIGKDATATNLISVMTGVPTTAGTGKYLQSTEEDNVFFFYDDHGNTGILGMPYGTYFTDKNLEYILETMTAKKMFKQFVGFFSACYSGSMLYKQKYPDNVYFASAAPIDASSYACYYDSTLRAYINSCWPFGVLDSVENNGLDVTIDTMFYDAWGYAYNHSQVGSCQYGDINMKANTFRGFLNGETPEGNFAPAAAASKVSKAKAEPVPQYLVPYMTALKNYEHSHSEADKIELDRQIQIRKKIDSILASIVSTVTGSKKDTGFLISQVCNVCDENCGCYTECKEAGKTDYECQRHCCNYLHCYSRGNGDETQCSAALSRAFLDAFSYINNDYLYVASSVFSKLCRYPNVDVEKVVKAIKSFN